MSPDDQPEPTIFVSYSHEDGRLVDSLVQLLRSADTPAFVDRDSIAPGELWLDKIIAAIDTCGKLWLFWCRHSSCSREVEREYTRAIERRKATVPILLDATPLPAHLSAFQWVDMQKTFGPHEKQVKQTMSREEAHAIQRSDRRGRSSVRPQEESAERDEGVPQGHALTDGNLFREGWEIEGDLLVRRTSVVREPAQEKLIDAASRLRPFL
jgi:TIR domain